MAGTFAEGSQITMMAVIQETRDLGKIVLRVGNQVQQIKDEHIALVASAGLVAGPNWFGNPKFQAPVYKPAVKKGEETAAQTPVPKPTMATFGATTKVSVTGIVLSSTPGHCQIKVGNEILTISDAELKDCAVAGLQTPPDWSAKAAYVDRVYKPANRPGDNG